MPSRAPISHHLDLYRYWDAKRVSRRMPARRDIEPIEIRHLLPYLILIDLVDGQGRYRLIGTAAAQGLGRDLTGRLVGSYVAPAEFATAMKAAHERVFTTGGPVFATGEYRSTSSSIHGISRLLLPLGENDAAANMVLVTRLARFSSAVAAGTDWLQGEPGKVCDVVDVKSIEEVEAASVKWERQCAAGKTVA